jgi:hypothetical protein
MSLSYVIEEGFDGKVFEVFIGIGSRELRKSTASTHFARERIVFLAVDLINENIFSTIILFTLKIEIILFTLKIDIADFFSIQLFQLQFQSKSLAVGFIIVIEH